MKCPNCNNEVSAEWTICPFCKYEPKRCPECNMGWLPQDAKFCPACGCELEREGSYEDDDETIDELLSCPNCESENIIDDGSGFLQYTCEDCGYNWGNRDDVTCPKCSSDDIWDDGNRFENQLTCNHCGHEWDEEDDNEEVVGNEKNIDPSVYINKIWTEIAYELGDKGMKIHLDIDMNGLRNESIEVAAYFYYATNNPIKDTNGKFRAEDGNVAASINTYPPYSKCNYNDLIVFIPIKEIHVNRECACYFIVRVWHKGKPLVTSNHIDFYVTPQ